jgi:hypothetical protein
MWVDCCTDPAVAPGSCFEQQLSAEGCCAFSTASSSYLAIPALRATTVYVQLPRAYWSRTDFWPLLRLEQDGFLRVFDVATILWPAGYLLTQWVATQRLAGLRVLELGSGVGAASVAAARGGARVVATDLEARSLALTVRVVLGQLSTLRVSYENSFCMGLLYGRAGRLTAENGGFRPRQAANAALNGVGATALAVERLDWHSAGLSIELAPTLWDWPAGVRKGYFL